MESAKRATFNILNEYETGQIFSGHSLMMEVKRRTGETHYPATMLRYLREYRASQGRIITNVSKKKSLYRMG